MFVTPVARVDHGASDRVRDVVGGTRLLGADHKRVDAHCLDGAGGVLERLTLVDRARKAHEVHNFGAEAFRGDRKARARAGGVLKEEIRDDSPGQDGLDALGVRQTFRTGVRRGEEGAKRRHGELGEPHERARRCVGWGAEGGFLHGLGVYPFHAASGGAFTRPPRFGM